MGFNQGKLLESVRIGDPRFQADSISSHIRYDDASTPHIGSYLSVINRHPISLFVKRTRLCNISRTVWNERVPVFDFELLSCKNPFHRIKHILSSSIGSLQSEHPS